MAHNCLCTGSPYQYSVGKIPAGGSHKVEFGGPGVEQGEVEAKSRLTCYRTYSLFILTYSLLLSYLLTLLTYQANLYQRFSVTIQLFNAIAYYGVKNPRYLG